MSALHDIQKPISRELNMLNERMKEALTSNNTLMDHIVADYMRSKGKMIRPIMVILSGKLLGIEAGSQAEHKLIDAAAAIEMLHNASLIHDDVIDEAKMRRNNPTINAVWDNHISVLVGDYFTSTALRQAIASGDIRIVATLSELGRRLSLGEINQIDNARQHALSQDAYFDVIRAKTASLFVACAQMGAYAAGVEGENVDRLCQYAESLGLCFQIRDDIFDYFSNPEVGKPTGNDLREGKVTLPLLYALERSDLAETDEIRSLVHSQSLEPSQIERITQFAIQAGGIEYAYTVMQQLYDQARPLLKHFDRHTQVQALDEIFKYIITRKH